MGMLVAGRFLQGIGAGGLAATAYVAVGRGFPAEAQPRLFALLSTGWVLPSLVGPAAAGFAAEHWGWRSVFLGLVVPVAALPLLVLPSLATLPPASGSPGASRVPAALVLAAGAGLAVAGLQAAAWPVVLGLLTLGIAIALPALRRLLPAGTGRARPGLAAVVASRLLVNLAFFGADTFLPLAATRIHGASPTTAGLVIIGGALAWTGGAAWSARRQAGPPSRKVVAGFALLAFGIAGASFVVWPAFPLWAVFLLWSVGGLGIGAVFNTTSVAGLASAPDGREGMVSSQLQIVDALGFAVAAGVGGALVGLADRTAVTLGAAVAVTFALAASAALLGTVAGRGVRAAVPVPAPPV